MKRNAISRLIAWKNEENRKPMVMRGIKGVGKTFLALDFAKSFYEGNLYVNFETNAAIRNYFREKAAFCESEDSLITFLCEYYEVPLELAGNLLFILDEITDCKEAVMMLEMLAQKQTPLSLLILSSEEPVLKNENYEHMTLYPMQFDEFLIAEGSEWYAEVIKGHFQTNRKVPEIVHKELLASFEDYLMVGGMPSAVNDYLTMEDNYNVADIHERLLMTMLSCMNRHATETESLKMSQILTVLPDQLVKDNKKFQFRQIRKGATYTQFSNAIQTLAKNGYLMINQKQGQENHSFQLYLCDTGILSSLYQREDRFLTVNKERLNRILIENCIMQNLTANGRSSVFWESSSMAKIDFIIENQDGMIPIEVKIKEASRQKSMGVYKNLFSPPYSYQISNRNFEAANNVRHIPFYAAFCL